LKLAKNYECNKSQKIPPIFFLSEFLYFFIVYLGSRHMQYSWNFKTSKIRIFWSMNFAHYHAHIYLKYFCWNELSPIIYYLILVDFSFFHLHCMCMVPRYLIKNWQISNYSYLYILVTYSQNIRTFCRV